MMMDEVMEEIDYNTPEGKAIIENDDKKVEENKPNRVFNMKSMPKNTPIYRIFRAEYLYEMIKNKENTLAHISQWNDLFEGFLFKQKTQHNGMPVGLDYQFKDYYGQCWSYTNEYEETSIRWPIYSSDKHGILVKSTFGKLWDSFYSNNKFYYYNKCEGRWFNHSEVACAIGKVKYLTIPSIKSNLKCTTIRQKLNKNSAGLIKTLLIKRKEFEYEKEIRIIFNDDKEKLNLGNRETMRYPIKPEDIFCQELIADPRMPDFSFEPLKLYFENKNFILKRTPVYELKNLNLQY